MSRTLSRRTTLSLTAAFALMWLGAAWLILGAVLRAGGTVTAEYWSWFRPFRVVRETNRLLVEDMPQFSFAEVDGRTIMAAELSESVRWLSAAPALLLIVMLLGAALALGFVHWHMRSGDFFHPHVVAALRVIAVILIGGGIAHGILDGAASDAIAAAVTEISAREGASSGGVSLDRPDFHFELILLGAVAGVLALAFRRGGELAEEAEGVV